MNTNSENDGQILRKINLNDTPLNKEQRQLIPPPPHIQRSQLWKHGDPPKEAFCFPPAKDRGTKGKTPQRIV